MKFFALVFSNCTFPSNKNVSESLIGYLFLGMEAIMQQLELQFAKRFSLLPPNKTPFPWLTLMYYCQLTGDTKQAVYARKKKHVWVEGQHYRIAPNGRIWININEVQHWLNQA